MITEALVRVMVLLTISIKEKIQFWKNII